VAYWRGFLSDAEFILEILGMEEVKKIGAPAATSKPMSPRAVLTQLSGTPTYTE